MRACSGTEAMRRQLSQAARGGAARRTERLRALAADRIGTAARLHQLGAVPDHIPGSLAIRGLNGGAQAQPHRADHFSVSSAACLPWQQRLSGLPPAPERRNQPFECGSRHIL
jgi:hypothetical protein